MALDTTFGACLLTVALISFLYWRKGPSVIAKVLVYLFSLATMKAAVKIVEYNYSFKFPFFLTGVHFASGALLAMAIMYYNHLTTGARFAVPSPRSFNTMFVPVAFCFGGSVVMNNVALVYTSTSFVEVVSAAGPITTVAIMVCMRKPCPLVLAVPCLIVFIGCALCSKSDPTCTWLGFFLAAGANVPRSLKTVLQQVLMQKEENTMEFSPLEVLAWTCVPSSLVMFFGSILQEGAAPYSAFRSVDRWQALQLLGAILLSCANACILNSANLFVIKDLGAVGSVVVAQTKAVLVILGGVSMLGETVPRMEFAGFVLVMIGVFMYNDLETRLKPKENREHASVEEKEPLIPDKAPERQVKEVEDKNQ